MLNLPDLIEYLDVKLLFICHNRENQNGVSFNDGIFRIENL